MSRGRKKGEQLRAFVRSARFPYILFFVLVLLWHQKLNPSGDDPYFRDAIANYGSLAAYLKVRYTMWSSRLLIETVLAYMPHMTLLWRLIDSLVMTGFAALSARLVGAQEDATTGWGLCALVLFMPLATICEAGWMATSINYTWPAVCVLAALLPLRRALCGERLPRGEAILSVPALLFACSHEQCCAALLGLLIVGIAAVAVRQGRLPRFCAVQLALCLACLAVIALCPGNKIRYVDEQGAFPGFDELPLMTKVEMGFSATGYALIFEKDGVFPAFALLLAALVWLQRRDFFARALSAAPAAASLALGYFPSLTEQLLPRITHLRGALGMTGTGATLSSIGSLMPDVLIGGVFLCVVYSLFAALGAQKGWPALLVLLAGLATRMMMGFSPTIWGSGGRTFIPLYTALIGLSALLLRELGRLTPQRADVLRRVRRLSAVAIVLAMFERIV